MLPLPLRTHLEEVVCRLCWALTPPALGVGAVFGPVQLLSGTAVPRLRLVESRGKPVGAPSDRAIGQPIVERIPISDEDRNE